MSSKKNNFLPLLLIGGGAAAAALLYGVGTKQNKEDLSVVDGVGTVGSGDFLASSGVSKGYDSVDLGIEDYANNRATADAFALPSDGANPEKVLDDSGEWGFMEGLAMSAGTLAATTGAVAGVRYMNKKVGSAPAAQGVGSAPAAQGVKSVGSTAAKTGGNFLKSVSPALKKIPVVGVVIAGVSAIDTLVNGVDERKQNTLGTEQWVDNTHMAIMPYGTKIQPELTTDSLAKENVGNMVTEKQIQHASGLSGAKYPVSLASKAETALVNSATGSSGDVLKVSGDKFTSYVPEKGMQIAYSNGGSLQQAVDAVNKARRRS